MNKSHIKYGQKVVSLSLTICGQCIAEMVLSDFLKYHYIDNDKISDFTVIEPSNASLAQGLQYLETFFENSKITAHNVSARHLTEDYIRPQSDTVIHIFSNVLDIIEFERHNITRILNSDMCHNHILVCVSPFYQENGRGMLMDEFGNMLRGRTARLSRLAPNRQHL